MQFTIAWQTSIKSVRSQIPLQLSFSTKKKWKSY